MHICIETLTETFCIVSFVSKFILQAVDEQNVPGYHHVDRLAEYLVGLRDQTSLCLTNLQAREIIDFWECLDPWDKQRITYAARHQDRLLSGRYRTPRRPSNVPGVESTTRCVLGASAAPAQWPNCCRLVENIFIRLCNLHPSPKKNKNGSVSRWSQILNDYHKIRGLVLSNARVMEHTDIQIVEVNQTTLIQWHNNRVKQQELSVLLQGTGLTAPIPVADEPLQEARALPAAPIPARQEHQYHLPQNTEGQARQRQTLRPILPKGAAKRQLCIMPSATTATAAAPAAAPAAASVIAPFAQIPTPAGQPLVLFQYVLPDPAAAAKKRPYRRTVQANTCKKCGQFRTAETGHSQFRGYVYCPNFESVTKRQWLEDMKKKLSN